MTVWGYCHYKRSEAIHKPTLTPLRHCERSEAIHNHEKLMQKQKIKRIYYSCTPSSLRDFAEVVAIHKPLFFYSFTEKKKEITIIYQIKELIFNFQFLSQPPLLLRNFPPYKGRQAPINHYSLPFVIARGETTKQSTTTNNKHKNRKEKEFHE